MNTPLASRIKIVGLNGTASVECGRALPVCRDVDGRYTVLDLARPLSWFTEQEAKSQRDQLKWSALPTPVQIPNACVTDDQIETQPMMVFVNDRLLDLADRRPQLPLCVDVYLIWSLIVDGPDGLRVACATEDASVQLLDEWANALIARFDAMHRLGRDNEYLKQIADFSLCAAKKPDTRWRAYTYYSTVQDSDKVKQMFDLFVQREFPDANWESFLASRRDLRSVLETAAPMRSPQRSPDAAETPVRAKLKNIAVSLVPAA